MFGGRSKRFYVILAVIYGLIAADLLVSLVSGDGNGISFVLAVVFVVCCAVCVRSARQSAGG
jgi:hypothetical protein